MSYSDSASWQLPLSAEDFRVLADRYRAMTSYGLVLMDGGMIRHNRCLYYHWDTSHGDTLNYEKMTQEAVRWGEPNILMDIYGTFVWCVPVLLNNRIVAGLFSANHSDTDIDAAQIRRAAWSLMELAIAANLVNSGLMEYNRTKAEAGAKYAETIHQSKRPYALNPRDMYLIEEPKLLAAVKNADLGKAREIINGILVGVYQAGSENLDELKTLVFELVIRMFRAVVDEGADPTSLVGDGTELLGEFLNAANEYELNRWLSRWLERFVNTNLRQHRDHGTRSLAPAIYYIRENLDKPLTRDEAAEACHLSPSYFSRVLKRDTGHTFSDLVNRFRIEYACALLEDTDLNANDVGFASGYNDHSYFTKVFKRKTGTTPSDFRTSRR